MPLTYTRMMRRPALRTGRVRPPFALPMIALALLAGCGSDRSGPAPADNPFAAIIDQRQENFDAISEANKLLKEELEASSPSLEVVAEQQEIIAGRAARIPEFFPPGSGPESGLRTDALPSIWENPEGFRQAFDRFMAANTAFGEALATGDVAVATAAADQMALACRDCHNDFRRRRN